MDRLALAFSESPSVCETSNFEVGSYILATSSQYFNARARTHTYTPDVTSRSPSSALGSTSGGAGGPVETAGCRQSTMTAQRPVDVSYQYTTDQVVTLWQRPALGDSNYNIDVRANVTQPADVGDKKGQKWVEGGVVEALDIGYGTWE